MLRKENAGKYDAVVTSQNINLIGWIHDIKYFGNTKLPQNNEELQIRLDKLESKFIINFTKCVLRRYNDSLFIFNRIISSFFSETSRNTAN